MSLRATLLFLGVLLTSAGLHGGCVGRELVGRKPVKEYNNDKPPPSRCATRSSVPPQDVPPRAQALDLSTCTAPSDTPCDSPTDPTNRDADSCMVTLDPHAGEWNVGSLQCVLARLDAPNGGLSDVVTATDVRLEQVDVTLAATTASAFEVTHSTLVGVSFVLLGPWTLLLTENQQLDDVRILAGPETRIHLRGEVGDGLTIEAPRGTVILQDTTLQRTRVLTEHLELNNSQISDGIFTAAEAFVAAGSALERVAIAAPDSLLTETSTIDVEVTTCVELEDELDGP
jgi:hypothetical protein